MQGVSEKASWCKREDGSLGVIVKEQKLTLKGATT